MKLYQLEDMLKTIEVMRDLINDGPIGLDEVINKIDELELEIHKNLSRLVYDKYRDEKAHQKEAEECPECGLPATHPSGLCRDCYQAKLEARG